MLVRPVILVWRRPPSGSRLPFVIMGLLLQAQQ
jgi:hypothetical protein